jgi:hypothetical protein
VNSGNRYAVLSDEQLQEVHAASESFEQALQNDKPVSIEDCLAAVAEETRAPLFCELLTIELELPWPSIG